MIKKFLTYLYIWSKPESNPTRLEKWCSFNNTTMWTNLIPYTIAKSKFSLLFLLTLSVTVILHHLLVIQWISLAIWPLFVFEMAAGELLNIEPLELKFPCIILSSEIYYFLILFDWIFMLGFLVFWLFTFDYQSSWT